MHVIRLGKISRLHETYDQNMLWYCTEFSCWESFAVYNAITFLVLIYLCKYTKFQCTRERKLYFSSCRIRNVWETLLTLLGINPRVVVCRFNLLFQNLAEFIKVTSAAEVTQTVTSLAVKCILLNIWNLFTVYVHCLCIFSFLYYLIITQLLEDFHWMFPVTLSIILTVTMKLLIRITR